MGQLEDFPGEPWGEQFLEQDLTGLIEDLRRSLGPEEYAEQQLSGFGNTTQSLLVLNEGAALTHQDLDDAALSLLVHAGRIHVETNDAHIHPDEGTNLFLLAGQKYEIQAVEPAALIATFMRFS